MDVFTCLPQKVKAIVGLGGGKALDVAKYVAFLVRLPYYAVPTSLSNDGFSSPQSSLTIVGRRRSLAAALPFGVVVDLDVCRDAPRPLWLSGVGDDSVTLLQISRSLITFTISYLKLRKHEKWARMDPKRKNAPGRDRVGWFSARHRSISFHDRPADRTYTAPFRRDLLKCLIELPSVRVVCRLLVRGEWRRVRRPGVLHLVRPDRREQPARTVATRVSFEAHVDVPDGSLDHGVDFDIEDRRWQAR